LASLEAQRSEGYLERWTWRASSRWSVEPGGWLPVKLPQL